MTVAVANVEFANTFGHWVQRTNELATAMSVKVLTADSNTTVGNVSLQGTFTANTLVANNITGTGNVTISTATFVFDSTSTLVTVGSVNVKGQVLVDSIANMKIVGSNATHNFVTADPATGTLQFSRVLIPLGQITNVTDLPDGSKSNNSILKWSSTSNTWSVGDISNIANTTIGTLQVGVVTSPLVVNGNTTLANSTLFATSVNKRVGVNTLAPRVDLDVNGIIWATGDIKGFQTSDLRFKKDREDIDLQEALDYITDLIPIEFTWDQDETCKSRYVSPDKVGRDVGLGAQQVESVLPKLVRQRPDGYLSVDYVGLIPYLVGAVKRLRAQIEELKNGN